MFQFLTWGRTYSAYDSLRPEEGNHPEQNTTMIGSHRNRVCDFSGERQTVLGPQGSNPEIHTGEEPKA